MNQSDGSRLGGNECRAESARVNRTTPTPRIPAMRLPLPHAVAAVAIAALVAGSALVLSGANTPLVASPRVVREAADAGLAASASRSANAPTVATGEAAAITTLPALDGAAVWLNSAPLDAAALTGHVVIVDFWTFLCSNCQAALPYVRKLDADFRDKGLITIGVHTPELAPERDLNNVKQALVKLGVTYPVPVDPDFTIWNRFNNRYWPSLYIFDKTGKLRYHRDGEGDYAQQRVLVQQLLAEERH